MSEPLCTCGHPKGRHHDSSLRCLLVDCSCIRFAAPSPPPARSRAEAEKAITAVLRDHSFIGRKSQGNRTYCVCGHVSDTHDDHRVHQASVLADLRADGPTLADAWETGFNDGCHYAEADLSHPALTAVPPNPFRVADTEGDR